MKNVFSALKNSFALSPSEPKADFSMPEPPPPPEPPQATLAAAPGDFSDRLTTQEKVEAMGEQAMVKDAERLKQEITERNRQKIESIGSELEQSGEEAKKDMAVATSTVESAGGDERQVGEAKKSEAEKSAEVDKIVAQLEESLNPEAPLEPVTDEESAVPAPPEQIPDNKDDAMMASPDSDVLKKVRDAEEAAQARRLRGEDIPPITRDQVLEDEAKRTRAYRDDTPGGISSDERRELDAMEGTGTGPLTDENKERYHELDAKRAKPERESTDSESKESREDEASSGGRESIVGAARNARRREHEEQRTAQEAEEQERTAAENLDVDDFEERKVHERPKPMHLRLLKSVMGKFGKDWEDRLDAWYHDRVIEYNLGPALRAADKIEKLQDKIDDLEEKVENYRGGWQSFRAAWYKSKLNRKREQLGMKEAEIRRYKGLMHEHVEQRNKYLRFMEQRYRGKMRPFEKLADEEKTRLTELRESNGSLREAHDRMNEVLIDLQQEGDKRKGLRLNTGYRRKVRDAKQQLREMSKKLRENEREIAARNSRLVDAEAEADPWRVKINTLVERSKDSGIPELETPDIVEGSVGGPQSIPGNRRASENTESDTSSPETTPDDDSELEESGTEEGTNEMSPTTGPEPETEAEPESKPEIEPEDDEEGTDFESLEHTEEDPFDSDAFHRILETRFEPEDLPSDRAFEQLMINFKAQEESLNPNDDLSLEAFIAMMQEYVENNEVHGDYDETFWEDIKEEALRNWEDPQ